MKYLYLRRSNLPHEQVVVELKCPIKLRNILMEEDIEVCSLNGWDPEFPTDSLDMRILNKPPKNYVMDTDGEVTLYHPITNKSIYRYGVEDSHKSNFRGDLYESCIIYAIYDLFGKIKKYSLDNKTPFKAKRVQLYENNDLKEYITPGMSIGLLSGNLSVFIDNPRSKIWLNIIYYLRNRSFHQVKFYSN